MIMRTELKAVPHASLSKNRLRCQVQTPPNDFPQATRILQTSKFKLQAQKRVHVCRKTDAMASELF